MYSVEALLVIFSFFGFGLLSSGGVFTVFVTVGIVPRFADKTHTAHKIMWYENCIVAGVILGCLCSVYKENIKEWGGVAGLSIVSRPELWGGLLLVVFGIFAGMFVGCFAIAIAEMLDSIPIFTRRISFRHGLGCMVLSVALGKLCGALFYFYYGLPS